MKNLSLLIETARPKQWTKNLIVFAAIIFSGNLSNLVLLGKVTLGFIALCFLSGSVYIINDLIDIKKDSKHPKKKNRPLASGRLSRSFAYFGLVVLLIVSAALSYYAGIFFAFAAGMYFCLQLLYSFFLKSIVIIDVMTIAAGFVLRAVAGAWAIAVTISPWLLICAALLALFLGLGKRRHELLLLEGSTLSHRPILKEYSKELLDEMISVVTASTVVSYTLYTFFSSTAMAMKSPYLMLTIPFVLYGIFRYLYLIHRKNLGGNPEEILITDVPTLINIALWLLTSGAAIYIGTNGF